VAARAEYPWCPTIAVAAALGTNAIEFVAGQYFHRRAGELAAAAADAAHSCDEDDDPEARCTSQRRYLYVSDSAALPSRSGCPAGLVYFRPCCM